VNNGTSTVAQLRTAAGSSDSSRTLILPIQQSISAPSVAGGGIAFDPIGIGSTTVSASADGFSSTATSSAVVNVTGAGISFQGFPARVGAGLQTNINQDGLPVALGVNLGAPDHGGVTIHLVSSNPDVLRLSTDGLGAGSVAIDVELDHGETNGLFWIEGMSSALGTVTITASAAGFSDATTTVDVVQPRMQLIGLSPFTTVLSGEAPFGVAAGLVHSAGFLFLQGVRAETEFTITNTNAAAAELRTGTETAQTVTVKIPADGYTSPQDVASGGVAFVPLAQGSTTVTASGAGFTGFFSSLDVIVATPTIIMQGLPLKVGAGLQTNFNPLCCAVGAFLQTPAPGDVTVRITSTNPAVALVAPNDTTAGAEFIDVTVLAGQTLAPFYVRGVPGTTGVVSISATAPGFQPGAGEVEIVQPALQLEGVQTAIEATGDTFEFRVTVGVADATGTSLAHVQQVRPGTPLTATVTNSNGAAAQLLILEGGDQSHTVEIAATFSSSPATIAAGGIGFDPLNTGLTTVTATIPGFLTTTSGTVNVDVTGGNEASPVANAGADHDVTVGAPGGTFANSTAAATVALPPGSGIVTARATFTLGGSGGGGGDGAALNTLPLIDGKRPERVEVAALADGTSRAYLISHSGVRFELGTAGR
jgi:hypothetical protein